jgi:hypothetical protein
MHGISFYSLSSCNGNAEVADAAKQGAALNKHSTTGARSSNQQL